MDSLLQLKSFRKWNDLSQDQVAEFLKVSRPFISNVEKGLNKLADDKIDAILFDSGRYGWDSSPLVPAYERLLVVADKITDNPGLGRDGSNPFGLKPRTVRDIRHAKQGITETIADSICKCCPEIDRNFLLQGSADAPRTEPKHDTELTNIMSGILSELTQIRVLLTDIRNSIIQ